MPQDNHLSNSPNQTILAMTTSTAICVLYALFNTFAIATAPQRDCYVGSPPFCNNSLTSDPTCRGLDVATLDGWKRMDCDYALYNVPTTARTTKKWIVIHSGGCDTYADLLGDFFAPDLALNLFGLRPCGGFVDSLCASRHDYDICTTIHLSFIFTPLHPTAVVP